MSKHQSIKPGTIIGDRYTLDNELGRGGMGAVYKAYDGSEERIVALKILLEASPPETELLRFQREFHTLARLKHPRIVEVFDYGVHADQPFYTMELLAGDDFSSRELREPSDVCAVLRDIASALAFLHAQGLVHRDLTPRNVRRRPDGSVKLIDFGVMATVGTVADVAGTPNYTAPETVFGKVVDGRTDIYALGALGYRMLTGSAPYGARSFEQLRTKWQSLCPTPKDLVDAVPEGLSELLAEMVSLEPLGRPSSAAVVMQRLSAVGGLPSDPTLDIQRGYLASAAMVGRHREMEILREGLNDAQRRRGTTAFIEAPSGTGKSRLLHELMLEAQIENLAVAHVRCDSSSFFPYATVAALLGRLIETVPVARRVVPAKYRRVLAKFVPSIEVEVSDPDEEDVHDPAEERMRLQRAWTAWFAAIAKRTTLVLLVDDLQRADEASATVLAALARRAHRRRLYLVTALRLQEPVRAPAAVASLRENTPRHLSLAGLDGDELRELVIAYFGVVPHTERLATWLRTTTDGSPLMVGEVVRYLVEHDVIRYRNGTWVLPAEAPLDDLPQGPKAMLEHRVLSTSIDALRLSEALAVYGTAIGIPTAVGLSGLAPATVFNAIDELTMSGIVLELAGRFRFRHDGLREAVLHQLEPAHRARLHLAVGEHLLATKGDAESRGRIGWHLLKGGAEERGAEHLEAAGLRLYEAQALGDCLQPLTAALEVLSKKGASVGRQLALAYPLLAAGWVSDRKMGSKHAEFVCNTLQRCAGLDVATRFRPIGRHLALLVGLVVAMFRWLFQSSPRTPSPGQSLVMFNFAVGYACALTYAANQREEVIEWVARTDPLDVFRSRAPYAGYLGMQCFPAILDGRLQLVVRNTTRAIALVKGDRLTPFSDFDQRFIESAMLGLRVIVDVNQFNPRLHRDLARIDQLGLRYYRLVAETARVVWHRYRGEEVLAREREVAMEPAALQLGSWTTDLQILLFAHPAYAICNDVVGLARCMDQLEQLCGDGFDFTVRLLLTKGEYHRACGDLELAMVALEEALAKTPPTDFLMRQWGHSALAETCLSARRYDCAVKHATATKKIASDPEVALVLTSLRVEKALALAEAERANELGNELHSEVTDRLQNATAEAEAIDCPPLAAALHEACARIALLEDDRLLFEVHVAKMTNWLRPTGNPALLATLERVQRLGRSGGRSSRPSRPSGALEQTQTEGATIQLPSGAPRSLTVTATTDD